MKVTVLNSRLNRRLGKPSVNAPKLIPALEPGTEIVTDGNVYTGDMVQGNNKWLKDLSGVYYWSGGTNYTMPPVPQLSFNGKKTFPWFDHLQIAEIWEKYNVRGEGVKVAVLDTGCAKIPDLESKIPDANTSVFVNQSTASIGIDDISDKSHGTRCASLIGAENKGDYIIGIAPGCELLVGKISISGTLPDFGAVLKGIKWAIDNGADVISISYSKEQSGSIAENYLKELQEIMGNSNVIIFVSMVSYYYPQPSVVYFPDFYSDYLNIVGASTLFDTLSPHNSAIRRDILCAPGELIESYDKEGSPNPLSGTSFSTAIIAGIAALGISYRKKNSAKPINNKDFIALMFSSSHNWDTNGRKVRIINPQLFFKSL